MSKKIKTNRKRRTCRFRGCEQLLSIYNMEPYCYVHQQIVMARQNLPEVVAGRHL